MIYTTYKEVCCLCGYEESVDEGADFFEGEEMPSNVVQNKATAKRYFQRQGWVHPKRSPLCPHCFVKLKDGYVVIDRFNQLYTEEGIYDFPTDDCIMPREQAVEFSDRRYNNELLKPVTAFSHLTEMLAGEIQSDTAGYYDAHPEVRFGVGVPSLYFN